MASTDPAAIGVRQPLWIALGINPLQASVVLIGVSHDEVQARAKFSRADDDTPYRQVFNLAAPDCGKQLFEWMRASGLPSDEAKHTIRELGRKLLQWMKPPGKRRKSKRKK